MTNSLRTRRQARKAETARKIAEENARQQMIDTLLNEKLRRHAPAA